MTPPEGFGPGGPGGEPPEGFGPGGPGGEPPEGMTPPEGMGQPPEGMTPPEGFGPGQEQTDGEGSTEFIITPDTHYFSGISDSPDSSGKTLVSFTVNGGAGMSSVPTGQVPALADIKASVEDLPDSDVQITIVDVPSEDYAETCLLSDGADALAGILPVEDGDYQLTIAVVGSNQLYTGASQWSFTIGVLPFSDIAENSPFYDAVKFVYDAGLMNGTGDGLFSPNETVTRAQAITVLARLAQAEAEDSDLFSDVAPGSWYSGYVGWAAENAIVEGDGQGHFLPNQAVTGEHMALMLARYAENAELDYTAENTSSQPLTRGELARMLMEFAAK